MYNSGKIIAGLALFTLIIAAPFLLNIGKAGAGPEINLDTPVIGQLNEKKCVEPLEFMRTNHPELLKDWREQAVREGQTSYTSSEGAVYAMSLEDNCLKCHSNRAGFCDSCHNYTAVDLYCWDCHDAGKGVDAAR